MPFAGREIAARFFQTIAGLDGSAWVACAGLFLLLFLAPDRGAFARRGPWAVVLGLVLPALASLAWAWSLRWVADDAFISFRYADNFAHGLGPVWNAGERVEGYTDPLWMALIALAIKLNGNPIRVSLAISLTSFVVSLGLVRHLARKLPGVGPPPVVSPAVLLVATTYSYVSFATSGLETMAASTLALGALAAAMSERPMLAGFAGIGATLLHPDHALLYGVLGLALLLERRGWRPLVRYAAPFFILFVPFWIARWAYYGWPMPNTYYAKSGPGLYWTEGSNYLLVSLLGGGTAAILLTGLVAAVRFRRTLLARYTFAAIVVFALYILRIGGDFMLGRLLVTLVPPAAILAEQLLRDLQGRARTFPWGAAFATLLAVGALPLRLVAPWEKAWGVADERTFYELRTIEPLDMDSKYPAWGKLLRDHFGAASPPFVLGFDAIGMVGYFSRLRLVDVMGLTETKVAHQPILTRGRPGHERNASTAYLFRKNVAVVNQRIYPPEYDALSRVDVGDSLVMYRLDAREIPSLPPEPQATKKAIDGYVATGKDPNTLACDLWFYRTYYFDHTKDVARWTSLVDRAAAAGAFGGDAARFLEHPEEFVRVGTLSWERGDDQTEGGAFLESPRTSAPPQQDEPTGNEGPYLDSYTDNGRDSPRGTITSPPFDIVGDVIEFHVGGGKDPALLKVTLRVDGRALETATGCGSDLMGERVWSTAALKGQKGQIEVTDQSSGGWGHIQVDRIAQWAKR